MHSNNPLAAELESENDAARKHFVSCLFRHLLPLHFRFEAAPPRDNDEDFFKCSTR
jgi:hypothetical protein